MRRGYLTGKTTNQRKTQTNCYFLQAIRDSRTEGSEITQAIFLTHLILSRGTMPSNVQQCEAQRGPVEIDPDLITKSARAYSCLFTGDSLSPRK